jgi:hypothetical protein
LAVQIEAIGVDKVKSAMRELESSAGHTSEAVSGHYAKAGRHLALVANEAVRAGEIGGTALQKILTVGGDMAGMFGAGGAVVGAIAVTGLAIYNYFDRAQKKIEEMAKSARAELRSLRDESAAGAAQHLNRVAGGDIYDDDALRRESMDTLNRQRRQLEATQHNITNAKTGEVVSTLSSDNAEALANINAELDRRNRILREGIPLLQATATAEAQTTIQAGKEGLAGKAQREADEAFKRHLQDLKDLAEKAGSGAALVGSRMADAFAAADKAGNGPSSGIDFTKQGLDEQIAKATQAMPKFDWDAWVKGMGEGADGLKPALDHHLAEMADTVRSSITHTLGSALYDGFAAAFSGKGLGGIFKSFGKTLLSGLGQIISEQGMIYLEYSGIMQAFTPLLGNPFTAGFAGAAIGAALIALGAALGAAAGGRGHGGANASVPRPSEITNIKLTATSVADQARYDPNRQINQMTVIGPGDPVAFRQIQQGLDNHARR